MLIKMDTLQEIKQKKKKFMPSFTRQDAHKKKKLSSSWRKPRGIDSKKRLMKNNRVIVKPGYGTPSKLRNKDSQGREIVVVSSLKDLGLLDPKNHSIVVSKRIGLKNKLAIFEEILKKGFHVHNISNVEKYISDKKAGLEEIKKKKQEKQKKHKKKEEKEEKQESIEDKIADDDKKKIDKKEIDRLLTKKF